MRVRTQHFYIEHHFTLAQICVQRTRFAYLMRFADACSVFCMCVGAGRPLYANRCLRENVYVIYSMMCVASSLLRCVMSAGGRNAAHRVD